MTHRICLIAGIHYGACYLKTASPGMKEKILYDVGDLGLMVNSLDYFFIHRFLL